MPCAIGDDGVERGGGNRIAAVDVAGADLVSADGVGGPHLVKELSPSNRTVR